MTAYLDANILVALFIPDPLSSRARSLLANLSDPIVISDLSGLEFTSTVSRLRRMGEMPAGGACGAVEL